MEPVTRFWRAPSSKLIPRVGVALFAVFFIVAFTLRQSGVGDNVTVRVAGIMAYAFLGFVVVVLLTSRARERGRIRASVANHVRNDPDVQTFTGTPVAVKLPQEIVPPKGDEPWSLSAVASGPAGAVNTRCALVREDTEWAVSSSVVLGDGTHDASN